MEIAVGILILMGAVWLFTALCTAAVVFIVISLIIRLFRG